MDKSIRQQIQQGLDLLNQEKWSEAIAYFEPLKSQTQEGAFIYYLQSFALGEMSFVDEAQKCLQIALTIDPQVRFNIHTQFLQDDTPIIQIIKCQQLLSQEIYSDAMQICAKILNLKPQYLPAVNCAAQLLFNQNNFPESNKEYEKILMKQNDYLLAFLGKCQIFEKLEKYEEALKVLAIAQQFHPLQKCIYFKKSTILEKLYKFKESLLNYDLLLQIDKTDSQIYIGKGNCLMQNKEYETAIWWFDKTMTLVPDQTYDLSIKKGQALVILKQYEQAQELFDYCINSDPEKYEGYLQKSYVFYEMKDFETALIHCDRVLKMRQDINKAYILKGNIIFKQYFSIDAIEYYDYVIQNFDENLEAQILKFRALQILGEYDENNQLLQPLIQSISDNLKQIPKLPFNIQRYLGILLIEKNQNNLFQKIQKFQKQIEQDFNIDELEQVDKLLQEQIQGTVFFSTNYYFLLSFKLLMKQDFVKSIEVMDKTIEQNQDDLISKFLKYFILDQIGLKIEAKAYFETLLLKISKDIDEIIFLFLLLKDSQIFKEALIVIEKAVELMPNNFYIKQWKDILKDQV